MPLPKATGEILVAGDNADDIGNQSGGWTITWQGSSGDTTPGTTILDGIQAAVDPGTTVTYNRRATGRITGDFVVVVVGEKPYAEGQGDDQHLGLSSADSNAIDRVCSAMPCVVVLVSGRPMLIADKLPQTNAFVAAWLPGTEGDGVADVLFGDYDVTGTLPITWPRDMAQIPINVGDAVYDPLFPYGFGLSYGPQLAGLPVGRIVVGQQVLDHLQRVADLLPEILRHLVERRVHLGIAVDGDTDRRARGRDRAMGDGPAQLAEALHDVLAQVLRLLEAPPVGGGHLVEAAVDAALAAWPDDLDALGAGGDDLGPGRGRPGLGLLAAAEEPAQEAAALPTANLLAALAALGVFGRVGEPTGGADAVHGERLSRLRRWRMAAAAPADGRVNRRPSLARGPDPQG